MPLVLHSQLPAELIKSYWSHNSGGEHAQKQSGEIPEINAFRIRRGEKPIDSSELFAMMHGSGVVAAHTMLEGRHIGPAIGYVVSRRDPKKGILDVKDFFVAEEHRGKGIGGFLLGRLITMTPAEAGRGIIARDYGCGLTLQGITYKLPGVHFTTNVDVVGEGEVARLRKVMRPDWSGIFEVEGEESYSAELFVGGTVSARLTKQYPGSDDEPPAYHIAGRIQPYTHVAFAAIAALNQGLPGIAQ